MALNHRALEFNGTSNFAVLGNISSLRNLDSFTWMSWIKVGANSKNQYQRAYVERQGTGSGIRFACTPIQGKLRFELAVRDGDNDTNYDFSYTWDDYWHHVAFSGNVGGPNPSYSMFLDGIEVARGSIVRTPAVEGDQTTNPISDTTSIGPLFLANYNLANPYTGYVFSSDRYWHGKIDDIIIFEDQKNQSEILEYIQSNDHWKPWESTGGTATDPLKYNWRFNETSGTTLGEFKGSTGGAMYTSVGTQGSLLTLDRPYMGDGVVDAEAPTAPTSPVTSNLTADGFTASWAHATDNVYVQFYEFQLSQLSNFNSYTSYDVGKVTSKQVTGLLQNVSYYWRVRAFDAKLNVSPYSAVQSLTTPTIGDVTPPLPPTNLTISGLSYSMWTLNWTASASSDETGYKVDIATDAGFTQFLTSYRNRDVGNVTTLAVFGADPITTYYIRIRAYDAAYNESTDSDVLTIQTTALPDITPPLPVGANDATSISSRAFTAHWDEAIDDTRVLGYYLDLSLDENFTDYVQTETNYWFNADVGNVTAIRIEGLEPSRMYYYRLRAYDSAGNVSENGGRVGLAVTQPPSLDEGGYVTTTNIPQLAFITDSTAATTNYSDKTTPLMVRTDTRYTWISFDLSALVGKIQSAMLRLYVTATTGADISIMAGTSTITEPFSWSVQPAMTGSVLSITANTTNTWLDIDVMSLLNAGNTQYLLRLTTTGTGEEISLSPLEGPLDLRPQLVVENDPQTSTQVQRLTLTAVPTLRRNYIHNPSFESGNVTGWTHYGMNPTVTTNAGAHHGSRYASLNFTTNDAGFYSQIDNAPAQVGDVWSIGVALRRSAGSGGTAELYLVEYSAGFSWLTSSWRTINLTSTWTYHILRRKFTNPDTAYASLFIHSNNLQGATVEVDSAILEKNSYFAPFFDGSTSGAVWTGAANASTSTIPASTVNAISQYVGDSNDNNVFSHMWKRPEDSEWIRFNDPYTNQRRDLKYTSTVFGPAYADYNLIPNPSFELNTNGWYTSTTSVLSRKESVLAASDYALEATTVGGSGNAHTTTTIIPSQMPFLTAQAMIKAPVGSTVRLWIQTHNSDWSSWANTASTIAYGTGEFQKFTVTHQVTNTNHNNGTVSVYVENTDGTPFQVDNVQLQASPYVQPYRDGSHLDGVWYGQPHSSVTGLMISPNTEYIFAHVYDDVDGIYNAPLDKQVVKAEVHRTAEAPDDALTVYPIESIPDHQSIFIRIPYAGDDNENSTCVVRYTRSDLQTWNNVQVASDRESKEFFATLTNLNPGTSYTIEATFTDSDGLFNTDNGKIEHTGVTTILSDAPNGAAHIAYGGFVLQGRPDDAVHVTFHDAFNFADRRVQVEDYPRVHGGIELENLWRPRVIRMEGVVEGDNPAQLADNLEALKRALALPKQRLVVDSLANRRRFFTASCRDFDAPQQAGRNYIHLEWQAEFICADPFAYDAVESTQPQITIPNNGTLSLSNDGDVEALPVITVKTASTSAITVTLMNDTTGEHITPQTTIVRGDRLVLDSRRMSVQKNGVEIDYTGGFLTLARGGNTIKAESLGAGAPSILFEMRWYNRYI